MSMGGAAIGSSLNYYQEENNEQIFEAPMWFVPTLPRVPRHGFSGWAWGDNGQIEARRDEYL